MHPFLLLFLMATYSFCSRNSGFISSAIFPYLRWMESACFSTFSCSMKDLLSTGKIAAAFCLHCEGKRGPKNIQHHLKCAMRLNIFVLMCSTCICHHQPQSNQLLNTGSAESKCAVSVLSCEVDGRKTRSLVEI